VLQRHVALTIQLEGVGTSQPGDIDLNQSFTFDHRTRVHSWIKRAGTQEGMRNRPRMFRSQVQAERRTGASTSTYSSTRPRACTRSGFTLGGLSPSCDDASTKKAIPAYSTFRSLPDAAGIVNGIFEREYAAAERATQIAAKIAWPIRHS